MKYSSNDTKSNDLDEEVDFTNIDHVSQAYYKAFSNISKIP